MWPFNFSNGERHPLQAPHRGFVYPFELYAQDILEKTHDFIILNRYDELGTLWKATIAYDSSANISTHRGQLDCTQATAVCDLCGPPRAKLPLNIILVS
jgi:hypothetical protein